MCIINQQQRKKRPFFFERFCLECLSMISNRLMPNSRLWESRWPLAASRMVSSILMLSLRSQFFNSCEYGESCVLFFPFFFLPCETVSLGICRVSCLLRSEAASGLELFSWCESTFCMLNNIINISTLASLAYLYCKNIQLNFPVGIYYILIYSIACDSWVKFGTRRKFVKCNICGEHLEMKNTCTNHIRRHLQKMHQIQLNDHEEPTQTDSIIESRKISSLTPSPYQGQAKLDELQIDENTYRKNKSEVWTYSQRIFLNGRKMAQCMYCGWRFEMKTSCTNQIRRHLQKDHRILLSEQKMQKDRANEGVVFNVEVPLPENQRARSQVWKYAERIVINDRIFIKCNYCGEKLQMKNTSTSPIRRHLEEVHRVVFSQKIVEQSKVETANDVVLAQLASVSLLSYRQMVEMQQICKHKKILNISIPSESVQIFNIVKRVFQMKCEQIKQAISSKLGGEWVISIESCEIQSRLFFSVCVLDEGRCMYKLPLIRQIAQATTEWIKDKIFWLLDQMGVERHQIKTLVSYDVAAMIQLAHAMGWTHQICIVQMINNIVKWAITFNQSIVEKMESEGQPFFTEDSYKSRLSEQDFKCTPIEEIIKKFMPAIIIPQNKLVLDVSMQNVLSVCYMARQRLEKPGCSIIEAETFVDTLTLCLLSLNSQISRKVGEQIMQRYQLIRNNELVWAGLYLVSQSLYEQYMSRCLFKKMQIAQIECFLLQNFDEFGEANFSKCQSGRSDEIWQEHESEVDQRPYNSLKASLQSYRQEGIKNGQLKQVEVKISMIPCRLIGQEPIFRHYPERLQQEDIICLHFLNWYFRSYKSQNQ